MNTIATPQQLREYVRDEAMGFAEALLASVVDAQDGRDVDVWMKAEGSSLLRQLLAAALMLRAEKRFRDTLCSCGQKASFKQHRPFEIHTVVPGRDVSLQIPYAFCTSCREGSLPLLADLGADAEGFTPALRQLGLLAAVKEPYEEAAETTLPTFAGVTVSRDKLHALVQEYAPAAQQTMREPPPVVAPPTTGPLYVGIDGGMAFVDKAWREIKLGVLFEGEDFVCKDGSTRGTITARQVVPVLRTAC
jgi:hypothetical protein